MSVCTSACTDANCSLALSTAESIFRDIRLVKPVVYRGLTCLVVLVGLVNESDLPVERGRRVLGQNRRGQVHVHVHRIDCVKNNSKYDYLELQSLLSQIILKALWNNLVRSIYLILRMA